MTRDKYLEKIIEKHTVSTMPTEPTKPNANAAEKGTSKISKLLSLKLETFDELGVAVDAAVYGTTLNALGALRGILTIWGERSSDDPICTVQAHTEGFVWRMKSFHDLLIYPKGSRGYDEALLVSSILQEVIEYEES